MTDEEITDRIAQEVVDRIGNRRLTRKFLRLVVRLHTLQAVGLLPPPAEIPDTQLGEALDMHRNQVPITLSRALAKCWRTYRRDYPELLP